MNIHTENLNKETEQKSSINTEHLELLQSIIVKYGHLESNKALTKLQDRIRTINNMIEKEKNKNKELKNQFNNLKEELEKQKLRIKKLQQKVLNSLEAK